jgi:hypothetical protein
MSSSNRSSISESSDEDDESKSKSVLRLELIYIHHVFLRISTNLRVLF